MHPIWTLADSNNGIVPFIIIIVVVAINLIRLVTRHSKQKEEERRREAVQPKSAPEPGPAAGAPKKETAATEVDRFLEELARQSGAPIPPRPQAPPRPRPPVTVAPPPPPPKKPVPAPRAPAPAARPHAPAAVHRAPAARPAESAEATMAEAMALPVEAEPVTGLPAMTHLSPLAQAVVLREILGPCRWYRPYRIRGW